MNSTAKIENLTTAHDQLWDGVHAIHRWGDRWGSCESQDRTLIIEGMLAGLAGLLEGEPFHEGETCRMYLNCPPPGECGCEACSP